MINQESKALRMKISSVASFCDLLQGAKMAQSYEFSHIRAQFRLCRINVKCKIIFLEL